MNWDDTPIYFNYTDGRTYHFKGDKTITVQSFILGFETWKLHLATTDPYPGQILGPQGPILITEGFDGKEDRQEWELLEILDF